MNTRKHMSRTRTLALAGIIPLATLSLVGCNSTSGTEEGADVEDVVDEDEEVAPYNGALDSEFYDAYSSYIGEEVTVSADVNEIVSDTSFTIAGTDDTTVEALLVVTEGEMTEVEPGLTVSVTGTVMESFDLPTVEEETGLDLEDDAYADYDGENYIVASEVDTSVDADS
ncbi:hypothetical protein BJ994_000689 [Arthrobacter pigmenti]|uniref:DUF5666 domain-containing protein n=1 Tax=Arthrobacter pigmenti TaxID=271432 RepID=A0A846REY2_9MICC|nr:hypothetical protein [Arthrobacter pigmenti]NJC21613.1 hypothetical protein [Arthrobacter pigmenti]